MPEKALRHTFRKSERLCSKKRIEALFGAGCHSLSAFPLRAVYQLEEREGMPVEVLVSVSKRRVRHAVDRNRVKRLIREAYRLNKHILWDALKERHMALAFLWNSDELMSFDVVERKVRNLLQRISEQL